MARGQQGGKGNPASKRMSNVKRKEYRSRLWTSQKKHKEEVRKTAAERHQKNIDLKKNGEMTPWQKAKLNRALNRLKIQT